MRRRTCCPADFRISVAGPSGLDASDALPFGTAWACAVEPFLVPKKARNTPGAPEMPRVMLGKRAARGFVTTTGALTRVAAAAEDGAAANPTNATAARLLAAAGRNVQSPRLMDWYPKLAKERVGPVFGALLTGDATPAEAVRTIQRAADETARDESVRRRRHP
ncbi:hypothetical protein [Streptomyces buecherae]|uniref:Extracellular solute-binding protein n=1 Tax=Streptomyces buecherae TaxID=2763006 RepID=A0A7H8NFJ1_9ACTN|nr:hypothetical protein [Streptomyces buecherae]QKW53230.1 hypothetical protein HUT08_30950 [Streptomyces buecherae]